MLFNSYEYIFFFLPLVFFGYFFLNQKRFFVGAKVFLVLASLFFYSWWNIIYLPIIVVSMFVNYLLGRKFAKKEKKTTQHSLLISKKMLLILGILFNISLLAYFKYSDFFIENINFLIEDKITMLNLALPLAISFFTFQQIAYLVDSYRAETKEYDFLNYALFVTFFPQLIAGPIVHHKEMMPQFSNRWSKVKRYKNIAYGFLIFSIGLFKKVVIADTFALWATNGFDHATVLNFFEAWGTSLSYTFQLYFDFSGYTNMAIGSALLFNIKLPINFNMPYKALDIQDFWRRWHITLSRFLKDYVYIPLGGNREGEFRMYNNLFLTFLIGGIWHGAGWTFIIWGALHGVAVVLHRVWQPLKNRIKVFIYGSKEKTFGVVGSIIAWIITFNFVNIAWVFFRANDLESAFKVLDGMFGQTFIALPGFLKSYILLENVKFGAWMINIDKVTNGIHLILLILFVAIIIPFENRLFQIKVNSLIGVLFISLLFVFSCLHLSSYSEFLYFRF